MSRLLEVAVVARTDLHFKGTYLVIDKGVKLMEQFLIVLNILAK